MSAPESSLSPETNDDLPPNHESPLIYSDLVESKPGQCKLCSFCNSNEGCSPIMARLFLENSRETKSKIMKDKIFELLWGCKSKEEKKIFNKRYGNKALYIGLCHFHDLQKKINGATGEVCSVRSFIGEREAKRCYGENDMESYKIDNLGSLKSNYLSLPPKIMKDKAMTPRSSSENDDLSRGITSITKAVGGKLKDFMSIMKKRKKRIRTPPTANTNGSDEPQRRRNKPNVVDQDYDSHHEDERKEPEDSPMDLLYQSTTITSQLSKQQSPHASYLHSPEQQIFTPTCYDTPLVAGPAEDFLDNTSMNVDDNSGGLESRIVAVNKKLFSVQLEKATLEELVAELNERCSSNDDNLEKVLVSVLLKQLDASTERGLEFKMKLLARIFVSVVLKQLDASTERGLEFRMKLLERIFSWFFLDTAANQHDTAEEEEDDDEEERRCNDDIYCETENYICLRRKSAYHSQLKHETWKKYNRCCSRAIARATAKITETYSNDIFVDKEDGLNLFQKEILDNAGKRLKIKTSSIRILSVEEIIAIRYE